MHPIDWIIVVVYFVWIVVDGLRRTKASHEVDGYFLANRSLPWWAVGLSVMATQISAITLVGTTGQGYASGLGFVQFYFGLPLAMIILSVTVVPFFHRARVYTAYEYLEQRFDARTRALTSLLFLMGRALSCGVTLAAPAVILSVMFGWNFTVTVLVLSLPTIAYTMFGGVQAVTWTDVKQIAVIVVGVVAAVVFLTIGIPREVGIGQALHIAGATGRLQPIDFRFDLRETYTFWSGLVGGLFLMLAYFGCDQSQVQRYLTAKSIDEGRESLMMSAFVKIPFQALILLTGVLVFVFYLFHQPPMLFDREHDKAIRQSAAADEYARLEQDFQAAFEARRTAALRVAAAQRGDDARAVSDGRAAFATSDTRMRAVRADAVAVVKRVTGDDRYNDVNYVFPTFIAQQMPVGLVGLLIAAIFAAAMSTSAGELNSLATATVIDFYRRHVRQQASDAHYLRVSRWATACWGIATTVVATFAAKQGSLIEVVNRYGSFFYGSLLGVFVLAIGTRRATARGAFWGVIAGMTAVLIVAFTTSIAFLWHNLIGCVVVVVIGMGMSAFESRAATGR